MKSFIFGEGQAAKTPQELARMRAVAEALARGTGSPRNVGEGLNALGSGLSAMITNMAADEAEQKGQTSADADWTAITPYFPPAPGTPGGDPGGVPVASAPQMDPASARVAQAHGAGPSMPGDMSAYADAIASIESAGSGDYAALGPTTKKGNRAYGRYQVMDFNVGPWTEAALGRRMSPQEFLNDPQAQDAVFNHRFGGYVDQYGPEGAASMWFTGRPHAPNAKDILGTSGAGYVGKFNRALQQRQARAPGPVQVASLDPSAGFPPRPPAPGSDVYGAVPAIDDRGEDQHAKFREWNPDPLGNEQANLQQIDPALQKVIARAKEIAGTDFVLGSGQRGEDMQKKALGWGWSGTMDSDHLGGGAADLWPLNDQQQVNFDRGQQDRITAAMKQAAQELGVDLEAGADWRNPDRPHFGMIGQTPLHNAPVPTPRPGGSAPNGQAAIAQALTPPAAAMPPAQAPAVNPQVAQALAPQGTQGRLPSQATPSLRPFRPGERRPNPDGSYSTEVSTTWQLPDGQWVNVPSLWMGRDGPIQFPANDEKNILGAMRDYESRSGAPFPRFASLQEAEAAARQRSADGGAGSAPPLPAPRTIPDAPMVASVPQQIQQQQPAPSVAQALMPPQQRPAPTGPMPEMAGNTTHIDTTRGPTMQQIMAAAANPWLNDSQRGLLNGLMQQQMAERDPLTAMQREKAQIELERLRNPPPTSDWSKMDDGRLFNQRTGEIKEVGGGSVDAPTVQKLKLPDGSELAVQWNGKTQKWDPIDAPQGGGGVTPPKKLTESQSKLTLFQSLQTETQPVLLDLEKQWNPANLTDAAARSTPIAGNFFQSEQGQMYNAAATAWAEGALRIATGAAATPEEMERTKKAYFAQPGDTPNTIAFKAQMREMYNRSIDRSLSKEAPGSLPLPSAFAKKFDEDDVGTPPPGWEDDWEFLTPEERQKVLGNG